MVDGSYLLYDEKSRIGKTNQYNSYSSFLWDCLFQFIICMHRIKYER